MRLLVGLGNPGEKYRATRHNVGFEALDLLAGRHDLDINRGKFSSLTVRGRINGQDVLLAKPQTFMNLSGGPVRRMMDYYRIDLDGLLVLHDDLDVELGRLKVAARGGSGGHKGVASIIESLGESEFARIKIGIGRPHPGESGESYVLGQFAAEEVNVFETVLVSVAEAAEVFITRGVAESQALFNRRKNIE